MKTLYLHLGLPKTATSSIQEFLKKNTEQLAGQGCVFPIFSHKYPYVQQHRNAHFLYLKNADLVSKDPPVPPNKWEDLMEECLGKVVEEFEHCDTVILSDEILWWTIFYGPINFLQTLPRFAENHGYHFKVIVYLRRQDQLMDSLYRTKVKAAKTSLTMREWYEDRRIKYPKYLDYEASLKEIADKIGQENVIVRRFEPDSWKEHSICMDFLDALGLDLSLPYINNKRKMNPSLEGNMVEIQRLINGMDSLKKDEKIQYAKIARQLSDKTEDRIPYNDFTQEETAAFLKEYEKGNEAVAKTYFNDGKPLFFEEVKEKPIWDPDNEQMLPDLLRFFTTVTTDLYRKDKEQEKEVERLNRMVEASFTQRLKRLAKKILRRDQ